ncbi:hypothetical protein DU478_00365 [Thalassococcus profundi]|uniref:Secreted protein n=1 Tax=Thalassococcus profundi TaxID=2282382 RepID=A0A369TRV6_9RHOB|nr:hypothetical protein [Thalassococcus profundi]RDD67973.1 hypothetical protein DU478_00365 [Thalassococcus profundi]
MAAATGVAALLALTGCGVSSTDAGAQCLQEAGQPLGVYNYAVVGNELVLVPGNGGTRTGADALNACIRDKKNARTRRVTVETQYPDGSMVVQSGRIPAGAMSTATPVHATDYRARFEAQTTPQRTYGTAHCPPGAPVLYGGTQYCGR